jgi:hypothetical protein
MRPRLRMGFGGLRGRLLIALVLTSAVTLAAAAAYRERMRALLPRLDGLLPQLQAVPANCYTLAMQQASATRTASTPSSPTG